MCERTLVDDPETEHYDFAARLDELRCHPNNVLRKIVTEARTAQQRWRREEMAATRVLDEREALGDLPDASISARTAQATLDASRALESLPSVAAAAAAGEMSWDQLQQVVELATPESDAEWAQRGTRMSPCDLQRLARRRRAVTLAEARARAAARFVRTWRDPAAGMGGGRWELPDVDAVLVDKVLDHMAERMRPPKGEKWDTLSHRKADALVELARSYA